MHHIPIVGLLLTFWQNQTCSSFRPIADMIWLPKLPWWRLDLPPSLVLLQHSFLETLMQIDSKFWFMIVGMETPTMLLGTRTRITLFDCSKTRQRHNSGSESDTSTHDPAIPTAIGAQVGCLSHCVKAPTTILDLLVSAWCVASFPSSSNSLNRPIAHLWSNWQVRWRLQPVS